MIYCKESQTIMEQFPYITIKENKVIVKVHRETGEFLQSCIFPTDKYPTGEEIHIYTPHNSVEINDPTILRCFDKVSYEVGRCYTNSENLKHEMEKNHVMGCTYYVGWLFIGSILPVHHAWLVYTHVDGKESVLDLSMDRYAYLQSIQDIESFRNKTKEEISNHLINHYEKARHFKNSVRCQPVGQIMTEEIYIGSPCEGAKQARKQYNDLIAKYPNHEIKRNLQNNGINPTQEKMLRKGLLSL